MQIALVGRPRAALMTARACDRQAIEAEIERLIDLLDRMDAGTEDREPDSDAEPSLGAAEGICQLVWCRGGDADLERGMK